MKTIKSRFFVVLTVFVTALVMFCGCINVNTNSYLTLESNFSGSRSFVLNFSGVETSGDKDPCYYYLAKHGEDLKEYFETLFANDEATKDIGVMVEVDDSTLVPYYNEDGSVDTTKCFAEGAEIVTFTIQFTDFNDYVYKLRQLANFNGGVHDQSNDAADEGLLTWVPAEKNGEFKYYYTDPVLTFDLDTGAIYYEEDTVICRFITGAVVEYMCFEDAYDETNNPDGVLKKKGSIPNGETFDFGDNDIINGGLKHVGFYGKFAGYDCTVSSQIQPEGDNSSFRFEKIKVQLDAYGAFDDCGIDTTNATAYLVSGKANASVSFDSSIDWYKAAELAEDDVIPKADLTNKLATGTSVSQEFTAVGDTLKVVGVNGAIKYAKTLSCEEKLWTVTFVANGETIKTVKVKDGQTLSETDIPEAPEVKDKSFKNWDKETDTAITSDVTITAVYQTAKKSGCSGTINGGFLCGTLLFAATSLFALGLRNKRKEN